MDRKDKVVTELQDKAQEEQKIKEALKLYGYPEWAFKQVTQNKPEKTKNKAQSDCKSRGMVVLPYEEGLSQRVKRI